MPSPGGRRARRTRAALAVQACAWLLGVALVRLADAGELAIRIERDSFWYDRAPASPSDGAPERWAPGAVARLVDALEQVLRRHAGDFAQPPPIEIVIRGVTREEMERSPIWSSTVGSYGCATLEEGVVVIDVAPATFAGRDALNDAELRSFLGHELVHAYQFARGGHGKRAEEIARRELQALDWELAHFEPDVRRPYREDVDFNRRMYRAMLAE